MTEEVRIDIHKMLEDIGGGLRALITTVLSESDSRQCGVLEAINQAVWKTSQEVVELTEGDKPRLMTTQEVRNLLNGMQGRVLTILEAVFESPTQCVAIKSLARQKIWRFYNHIAS